MANSSLNNLLSELRRILFELREHSADPNDIRLAVKYINTHLEPLDWTLADIHRVEAMEAIADAALHHAFLRWDEGEAAQVANHELWLVCDKHRSQLPHLGPPEPKADGVPRARTNDADDPSARVHVSWLGLRLSFPARDGVAGRRDRLSWVVVSVDGNPLVRLYCDHDLSHEFVGEPGRAWRPTDPQALRWWVEPPPSIT
ncbi:MAG: hypothetical protein AAFS10_01360 [Myxococcota bacterium]